MNLCVPRNVFALALCLLTTGILSAQLGLSVPFVNNANTGSVLNVPVKVTGFQNIAGIQFVLTWDPQVLSFMSVDNFNLPGLDAAEFNTMQAVSNGIIRFAWTSPSLDAGTSLPDESTIFRVRLLITGAVNSGTAVNITQSPPTNFEISQINNGVLQAFGPDQVEVTQGFVAVGYTVGTSDVLNDPTWAVTVVPNPFSESAQIFFENNESADIQAIVTDVAGKIILEKNIISPISGQYGMEIASSQLREKGMYFLILRTDKRSCVRPLFLF